MKRFTKLALLAGLAMGAANLVTPSQAQADVHIGLGFFGPPAPVSRPTDVNVRYDSSFFQRLVRKALKPHTCSRPAA